MPNLKLDTSHDIIIGRGTTKVTGDDYVVQLVKCRLLFALDTWELDPKLGLPWIQDILVKDADSTLVRGLIRNTILKTEGVASVDSLSMSLDTNTRGLTVSFTATTDEGTAIAAEV